MELYLLITGVVTFVAVICIAIYLEKNARANAERFKKEREDAQLNLQSLVAIHSLIESTQGKTNSILSALQAALEKSNSLLGSQEVNAAKRADDEQAAQGKKLQNLAEKADQLATQLKNLEASIKTGLATVCETEEASAGKLRQALGETTKQIQALKQSLEESIKF